MICRLYFDFEDQLCDCCRCVWTNVNNNENVIVSVLLQFSCNTTYPPELGSFVPYDNLIIECSLNICIISMVQTLITEIV